MIRIWKTLYLSRLHSVQLMFEDLDILERSFACLKQEEHMFDWLARVSIKFGCFCASMWFLV